MEDYYKDQRLSASKLKAYLQHDPEIAHHLETNPTPSTDALRLGSALHLLMEKKNPIVSPYDAFRTKEAKMWKKDNPYFLKASEITEVDAWQSSILNTMSKECPRLMACWENGEYEKEYYTATHKAKVDCINNGILLDWKTGIFTSADQALKAAWNYDWALQAYIYKLLSDSMEFHFVAVSKTKPYPCYILSCTPDFFEYGEKLFNKAMAARDSFVSGKCKRVIKLAPPSWEH
jgi:hypothetical protein